MTDIKTYNLSKLKLDKTPRPQQEELLDFTINAIKENKKYTMIDAPTGSGKSFFTVMFMDWFKKNYDPYATFDILTDSKILQEQYTNDYDFMNSLWGKGSYECEKHQTDCATGMEFCKLQGEHCEHCPYKEAKWKFENGDISLTNFHLFLTYMLYMPGAWKRSSRVLIIDEAHNFESVTCDFITTKISKPLLKANGFKDDEVNKVYNVFGTDPESLTLKEFCEIVNNDFLSIVKSVISRLSKEGEEGNTNSLKKLQSLSNNFLKWESLLDEYNKEPSNWILEVEEIKKYNKDNVLIDTYYEFIAQPVWAYDTLAEKIWPKYDFVIFMSGTILDKKLFSDINGLDVTKSAYKALESPFLEENRPIYFFYNLGKQTYNTKQITWNNQLPILKKILKKHKGDKGIIHTANYEIQNWVSNGILENRILAHSTDNRNEVLNYHYQTKDPTVLVSPSMITGVDLTDDFSRHQTLLKMPYPNLGSKKIKKRMNTNSNWYNWKTVVDLMQSYGRSVRSKEDKANTYILDGSFSNILKWSDRYIPNWFKKAIKYIK